MTDGSPTPEQQQLLTIMQDMRYPIEERAQAGNRLAEIGDPRSGSGVREDGIPDLRWCEVPGNDKGHSAVIIGGDEEAFQSLPAHLFDTPTFFISKYPITHCQFQPFVADGVFANDQWWQQGDDREAYEQGFAYANHPRECVTWYAAMAYCRWLSAMVGYEVRLPTEAEWEKAARGEDRRFYPWGDEYISGYANLNESHHDGLHFLDMTSAVGIYPPDSASPYGVMDMAGNVWEWTLSAFEADDTPGVDERVMRGGSWVDGVQPGRCASRLQVRPDDWSRFFGFRVVCRLPS